MLTRAELDKSGARPIATQCCAAYTSGLHVALLSMYLWSACSSALHIALLSIKDGDLNLRLTFVRDEATTLTQDSRKNSLGLEDTPRLRSHTIGTGPGS